MESRSILVSSLVSAMGSILRSPGFRMPRRPLNILSAMAGEETEKARRLAAVDVGSNTVHALVAKGWDARLEDIAHYVEMPELGVAVERTGRIGPEKEREAIGALGSVLTRAAEHGYEQLVAGATAAVRRAADRDEFLKAAGEAIGVPVRLISEQREA